MKRRPNVVEFATEWLGLDLSEPQEVLLRAIDGLPLDKHQLDIFRVHTGRQTYSAKPCKEATVLSGARGGKTGRIAATHAVHKAVFSDHKSHLARGERATIVLIAQDFKAGRVAYGYVSDYLTKTPLLRSMVEGEPLASEIRLTNKTDIVVFPCTRAATRAYSIPFAYLDETALWRLEGSADSDVEIQTSVRRGMIQFPQAQIVKTSTPYLKDGVMYSDYQNHWGVDDSPVLVWKASSLAMNPSLAGEQLGTMRKLDPYRYQREFEAEWVDALTSFLPAAWVEAAVRRGRQDNRRRREFDYVAAVDQSQLRGDAFTLAIGHLDDERVVMDLVRAWGRASDSLVNLEATVQEIVDIASRYGTVTLIGDQSSKDWVAESIARAGGAFVKSEKDTSTCYLESEPFFSQGRVELPDDPQLIRELKLLERRPRPGGKVVVDHPRGAHDDRAAAVCRAIAFMAGEGAAADLSDMMVAGRELPSNDWNEDSRLNGRASSQPSYVTEWDQEYEEALDAYNERNRAKANDSDDEGWF